MHRFDECHNPSNNRNEFKLFDTQREKKKEEKGKKRCAFKRVRKFSLDFVVIISDAQTLSYTN